MRWRPPTRGQVVFLSVVGVLTALGAALAIHLASPVAPSLPASVSTPRSALPFVPVAELPVEARETIALIGRGGPYPYGQDGTVFNNLEGRLPIRPSGYYHEYTVPTPGSRDRGMRRLIRGDSGDLYYTSDHYASFRQVQLE